MFGKISLADGGHDSCWPGRRSPIPSRATGRPRPAKRRPSAAAAAPSASRSRPANIAGKSIGKMTATGERQLRRLDHQAVERQDLQRQRDAVGQFAQAEGLRARRPDLRKPELVAAVGLSKHRTLPERLRVTGRGAERNLSQRLRQLRLQARARWPNSTFCASLSSARLLAVLPPDLDAAPLDGRPCRDRLEPALEVGEILEVLALVLVRPDATDRRPCRRSNSRRRGSRGRPGACRARRRGGCTHWCSDRSRRRFSRAHIAGNDAPGRPSARARRPARTAIARPRRGRARPTG